MIIQRIVKALEDTGLESYNITRGNGDYPCVVYTYTSRPLGSADNKVVATEYTVLLNVLVLGNVEDSKNTVIDSMRANGFYIKELRATQFVEQGSFFNTPIIFKIILQSEV